MLFYFLKMFIIVLLGVHCDTYKSYYIIFASTPSIILLYPVLKMYKGTKQIKGEIPISL
jgi:hypothetical protein